MKLADVKRKASYFNGIFEICESLDLLNEDGSIKNFEILPYTNGENKTGTDAIFTYEVSKVYGREERIYAFYSADEDLIEIIKCLQILAEKGDDIYEGN